MNETSSTPRLLRIDTRDEPYPLVALLFRTTDFGPGDMPGSNTHPRHGALGFDARLFSARVGFDFFSTLEFVSNNFGPERTQRWLSAREALAPLLKTPPGLAYPKAFRPDLGDNNAQSQMVPMFRRAIQRGRAPLFIVHSLVISSRILLDFDTARDVDARVAYALDFFSDCDAFPIPLERPEATPSASDLGAYATLRLLASREARAIEAAARIPAERPHPASRL